MRTIQYLLDNGAGGKKIFLENGKGQTVMDIAEKWADISSFRALREHYDKVPKPKVKIDNRFELKMIRKNAVQRKRSQRRRRRKRSSRKSKRSPLSLQKSSYRVHLEAVTSSKYQYRTYGASLIK